MKKYILILLSYAFISSSQIKTDLEHDLSFSKFQLGLFDTALLLPYALVQV